MGNEKILSILIPTFNRENYLDNCLKSIFSQLDNKLNEKIEIIVSNNASKDNTEAIMKKYKKYKEVDYKYSSNLTNLGFDGNFYKLVNEAKGKFCWILGDNEFLLENSLKKIVDILEKYKEVGLLHIKRNKIEKIVYYDRVDEFLKTVSYNITFISGMIWKKDINFNLNFLEANGSCLLQLHYYFNNVTKISNNIIYSGGIFSTLDVENGGYRLFEVFSTKFNEILEKYKIGQSVINKINNDMCSSFFPVWILKAKNKKIENKFKEEDILTTLKEKQGKYLKFWLIVYPVIKLNFYLAKSYYRIIKKILKILSNF